MLGVEVDGEGAAVKMFGCGVELDTHLRGAVSLDDGLVPLCASPILVIKANEAHVYNIRLTTIRDEAPVGVFQNELVIGRPSKLHEYVEGGEWTQRPCQERS